MKSRAVAGGGPKSKAALDHSKKRIVKRLTIAWWLRFRRKARRTRSRALKNLKRRLRRPRRWRIGGILR